MKTTKLLLFPLLMAVMAMMPKSAMSQVTIGSGDEPQPFSLLELISNNNKGLRLPQLTNSELVTLTGSADFVAKEKAEARGLTVYNSTRNCVQYWNSDEWISVGVCLPVPPLPTTSPQTFCSGKTVSDLLATVTGIVAGNTVNCYNVATDGTALSAGTELVAGSYYISQTSPAGVESGRTSVTVTVITCSRAFDYTITGSDTRCILCGEDADIIKFEADADVINPVFRLYTSQTATVPFATVVGITDGYKVPVADLGIDLSQNKQGGYVKYYVSVSGDNYLENATGNRKEITVSGAAIPEFASYNLGADAATLNGYIANSSLPNITSPAKAAMYYLANNNFDDVDGHVYGGRFQWGREWDDTDNTTSYQIKVDEGSTKYQLWKGTGTANHTTTWTSAILYNSAGQITNSTIKGHHVNSVYLTGSSYDWHYPPQNDALWGNGKAVGGAYDMANLDYAAGTGVLYNHNGADKWYQSPQTPTQYANNDPCKKMNTGDGKSWRLPTQDEWERLANYDCNPTNASAGISFNTVSGGAGKAYTWVPVVCANGECNPHIMLSANSGFAVYKTSDLSDVTLTTAVDLLQLEKDPVLFLPAAGYRTNLTTGALSNVGTDGYYWNSGVFQGSYGYGSYLGIGCLDNFSLFNTSSNGGYRVYGFSVRCVADSTNY